jgi:hypothetical protein
MPDEITIKPKSESEPTATTVTPETPNFSFTRIHLINLCAAGLGICFFLPWASFFGSNITGFDLQKTGDEQRLLWLIPIGCAFTTLAGVTKRNQKIVGQLTGALPFLIGIYWYLKLKDDFFHILTYGAYLSLIFGAALFFLSRKAK